METGEAAVSKQGCIIGEARHRLRLGRYRAAKFDSVSNNQQHIKLSTARTVIARDRDKSLRTAQCVGAVVTAMCCKLKRLKNRIS